MKMKRLWRIFSLVFESGPVKKKEVPVSREIILLLGLDFFLESRKTICDAVLRCGDMEVCVLAPLGFREA